MLFNDIETKCCFCYRHIWRRRYIVREKNGHESLCLIIVYRLSEIGWILQKWWSLFATQQIKLAFSYLIWYYILAYLHSITGINQVLQIKIFNEVKKFAREFLHDPVWLHYFAKENEISLKDIILRILELKFLNHVANRGISLMQFRQLWHLLSARYYQLATRMTLPFEDRYKIIAV